MTQQQSSQSQALFYEAASLIFHRWTALQLAIAHETAGPSTFQLASTLLSDIVSYLASTPHNTLDPYDIAEGLEEYFINVLKISLEDESGVQVAKSMMKCYDMIVNRGDTTELERLRDIVKESSGGMKAVGMSRIHADEGEVVDGESDDDEDEEDDDEDAMDAEMPDTSSSVPSNSRKTKRGDTEVDTCPVIDNDGFELVARKGRRRH